MTNLNETLVTVIEKIKKHRSYYEKSEAAVRMQIIDPILASLGWDTANPEEVKPNVSIEGGGIPDYSLIINTKTKLFIEAKNLSENIEENKVIEQLAEYSSYAGTAYGILTNGAKWTLHKTFIEGIPLPERVVWRVDIEHEKIESVLRKLSTISKDNVEQIEILVSKSEILDNTWKSLLNNPGEMIKGLMPTVKTHIEKNHPDYAFNDVEIEDFLKEKMKEIILPDKDEKEPPTPPPPDWKKKPAKKPERMRLAGEAIKIKKANEILVETANWLIKKGKLKISNYPIPAGPDNYLINKEPNHRNGNPFKNSKQLSNGLWIFTNFSTPDCEEHSMRLLEKFGYSRNILEIDWRKIP